MTKEEIKDTIKELHILVESEARDLSTAMSNGHYALADMRSELIGVNLNEIHRLRQLLDDIDLIILAPASSTNISFSLFKDCTVYLASTPFSKRLLASVLKPVTLEFFLTVGLLNKAASRNILLVFLSTAQFSLPINPDMAIG